MGCKVLTPEIITSIFQVCIIPILGFLTKAFIDWVKIKADELIELNDKNEFDKYISMISDTIQTCVTATNQTYVDAMKEKGEFNVEVQKYALQKCLENVKQILGEDCKKYLATLTDDIDLYLTQQIECYVRQSK